MKICLIDTCILINVLYSRDLYKKIFSYLKWEGYHIIIPKMVQKEFTQNHPREKKLLNKTLRTYQLEICAISNNIKELSALPIDNGEADAFFQIQKMKINCHNHPDFLFITNDKKAIKFFNQNSLNTKTLKDFTIYI